MKHINYQARYTKLLFLQFITRLFPTFEQNSYDNEFWGDIALEENGDKSGKK